MKAGLDRVILKKVEKDSDSGFKDTTVEDALVEAEIVSVGFDREGNPLPILAVGDKVFIDGKAAAKPIPGAEDLLLMRYTDVLIII
jgi:co-chaperonin GroES (HSP10)